MGNSSSRGKNQGSANFDYKSLGNAGSTEVPSPKSFDSFDIDSDEIDSSRDRMVVHFQTVDAVNKDYDMGFDEKTYDKLTVAEFFKKIQEFLTANLKLSLVDNVEIFKQLSKENSVLLKSLTEIQEKIKHCELVKEDKDYLTITQVNFIVENLLQMPACKKETIARLAGGTGYFSEDLPQQYFDANKDGSKKLYHFITALQANWDNTIVKTILQSPSAGERPQ